MIFIVKLIGLIFGIGSPFFIFLDFHKKHNVHKAIIFIIAFSIGLFLLRFLVSTFSMVFAATCPLLLILFLIIASRRKKEPYIKTFIPEKEMPLDQ